MTDLQELLVLGFLFFNLMLAFVAFHEVKMKQNAFGLTRWLFPLGSFVWGDALVFSAFWTLVSVASIFAQDWLLFWLLFSVFWLVRSLGEVQYWFNQQFAAEKLDEPESLVGYAIFQNHSIYFAYQIFWQCVAVGSLVWSVYLFALWV